MKLLHISDLHLGRSLQAFSLLDVQRDFLAQVLDYIRKNHVDALLLCGDIYARTMPSLGAVELLNSFLVSLHEVDLPVLVISGNHDSPERLCFLGDLLAKSRIYLSGAGYTLGQAPVTLMDEYGPVDFHLLPFFRPGVIRAQAPEESIDGYDDAVRVAVEHMPIRPERRNVLLAHQFVTSQGGDVVRSESELLFMGGTEAVSASHFDAFDYVALGHLHRCQQVGRESIRYAGAPLKYSVSEADDQKYFLTVELGPKGAVQVEKKPVTPSVDLRRLQGTMDELLSRPVDRPQDFFAITLTDDNPVFDAMQRLRTRFPHAVSVRMLRDDAAPSTLYSPIDKGRLSDPMALFEQFYRESTGREMSDSERGDILAALKDTNEEAIL